MSGPRRASLVAVVLGLTALGVATSCVTAADPALPAAELVSPHTPYPPGSLPTRRNVSPTPPPPIASYVIDARYDETTHTITGTATLTFRNTSAQPVSELPFHLYMNAFKNEASAFWRESGGSFRDESAGDDAWGWIEVSSIRLGASSGTQGTELRPMARVGDPSAPGDETTLVVPLPDDRHIEPGATITLAMAFVTQLPPLLMRTGHDGAFTLAGQWYPKLGVLEVASDGSARWRCDAFHANAEFYADIGDYDVTLDVPATHVIAATGVLLERTTLPGGRARVRHGASGVHDFAWMADPHMQVARGRSRGGVEILVVHRAAQVAFAPRHVEAARRALDFFGDHFFPYPWAVMTVVDVPTSANDTAGGMEYPTLVTTADDAYWAVAGVRVPEFVTVHEVGHNWFQGVLASDEGRHAWMDEGINQYVDQVIMSTWDGEGLPRAVLGLRAHSWELERVAWAATRVATPVTAAARDFETARAYGNASYSHTALALATLEGMVGRAALLAALGHYARSFAYRHPTPADLLGALAESLGSDVRWFLDPALAGGEIALEIAEVTARRRGPHLGVFGEGASRVLREAADDETSDGAADAIDTVVTVVNTGSVPVEVDVEARYADGRRVRQRWTDRQRFVRLTFRDEPVAIELDPDRRVLLERDRADNIWHAMPPDTTPAWRGAAAGADVAATALGLLGP